MKSPTDSALNNNKSISHKTQPDTQTEHHLKRKSYFALRHLDLPRAWLTLGDFDYLFIPFGLLSTIQLIYVSRPRVNREGTDGNPRLMKMHKEGLSKICQWRDFI